MRAQDSSDQQILQQARHAIVMYYAFTIFDNVELRSERNGVLTVSGHESPSRSRKRIWEDYLKA